MKILSLATLAMLLSIVTACTSQPRDIVGRWTLDVAAIDPAIAKNPENSVGVQSSIEFTSDGKFRTYSKFSKRDRGERDEGTYTVSDHKITTTIEGRDNTLIYQIKDGKLILQEEGYPDSTPYKRM